MSSGAAGAIRHAPAVHRRDERTERRERRECGVATVVAAVLTIGLVVIAGFGLALGSAMLARHRAEGAADLAALGAAARAPRGPASACSAAGEVADAMRVRLLDCALDGPDARIVVETRVPVGLGALSAQVTARSRAGPVRR
ncbi:flp pilus-assembly TadE/G-like family protein [Saccharopolyspora sp. NFXS83]|uniref:Rv3654c family TadE-like protein n=1 Tax=Saccharopolyspora sp. NFXS83 TaxID=2993560 RepID=UPI00224B7FB8|nr:Rv3654c family TadE-like protein [Saccharopolyspora sp. NFXS83]MCX2732869.1 flp pilus-assembly TadE/G-like family protein [Saccharopolyspora sp. NFXS83]